MSDIPIDLVIPVYNEGEKIIKLFNEFQNSIKTKYRVLLCYDSEDDNIFDYKNEFEKYKFEIKLLKNLNKGPSSAAIKGMH